MPRINRKKNRSYDDIQRKCRCAYGPKFYGNPRYSTGFDFGSSRFYELEYFDLFELHEARKIQYINR